LNNYKETHTDGSNQFVYTRFLVPELMDYSGWAIYMDGDMVIQSAIDELWKLRDESKAVMVVKHNYQTQLPEKYLGSKNEDYPRKNWSSVIMWNCAHTANQQVTTEFVQNNSGSYLHRFSWLADSEIGELPIEWNWLADEYGPNPAAKLVHYTLGTPCFEQCQNTPMAQAWHSELKLTTFYQNNS
jgi:lipopolysaccharide biosynthesis glycosyltransferase